MRGVPSQRIPRPDWAMGEAPMPLTRELPPASIFPHEALGTIGSGVVTLMHQVIQAPVALVGQTILAAMNQASQPYANVCIDGRVSPLSEYFLTLGESGERKSAADAFAKQHEALFAQLQEQGLTHRAMAAELNARGITAAKGGEWTHGQVQRILNRYADWAKAE